MLGYAISSSCHTQAVIHVPTILLRPRSCTATPNMQPQDFELRWMYFLASSCLCAGFSVLVVELVAPQVEVREGGGGGGP